MVVEDSDHCNDDARYRQQVEQRMKEFADQLVTASK